MKDERSLLLFNAETDMKNIFVNSFFFPQIILLQATLRESEWSGYCGTFEKKIQRIMLFYLFQTNVWIIKVTNNQHSLKRQTPALDE